jgi:hypothetical protein
MCALNYSSRSVWHIHYNSYGLLYLLMFVLLRELANTRSLFISLLEKNAFSTDLDSPRWHGSAAYPSSEASYRFDVLRPFSVAWNDTTKRHMLVQREHYLHFPYRSQPLRKDGHVRIAELFNCYFHFWLPVDNLDKPARIVWGCELQRWRLCVMDVALLSFFKYFRYLYSQSLSHLGCRTTSRDVT